MVRPGRCLVILFLSLFISATVQSNSSSWGLADSSRYTHTHTHTVTTPAVVYIMFQTLNWSWRSVLPVSGSGVSLPSHSFSSGALIEVSPHMMAS